MGQNTGSVVHVCRRAVSFHSMNTTTTTITSPHKPQRHTGSVYHRSSASPSPNNRSINLAQVNLAVPFVLLNSAYINYYYFWGHSTASFLFFLVLLNNSNDMSDFLIGLDQSRKTARC